MTAQHFLNLAKSPKPFDHIGRDFYELFTHVSPVFYLCRTLID